MTENSWAEIQRLAADLQRVQLGAGAKRLAERNCIELVTQLKTLGLIDVVHSLDGRDYITRGYLKRQIENEISGTGNRASLVTLQEALNVEFHLVEEAVEELLREEPEQFIMVVGQILTRDYIIDMCRAVNQTLADEGSITVGEITKRFDLPSDFVKKHVLSQVGNLILAQQDRDDANLFYTSSYMAQQQSLIRGALSGAIIPVSLGDVIKKLPTTVKPSLAIELIQQNIADGQLRGTLEGTKHIEHSSYIPAVFTDCLRRWARDTFLQTGSLDKAEARRLGWTKDVEALLYESEGDKAVSGDSVIALHTCLFSRDLWNQAISNAMECFEQYGVVDLRTHIPQNVTPQDCSKAASDFLALRKSKTKNRKDDIRNCDAVCFFTPEVASTALGWFAGEIEEKAAADGPTLVKQMKQQQQQQTQGDDDDDEMSGKKGKGKGRGKKGKGGKASSSAAASSSGPTAVEFMKVNEIEKHIQSKWPHSDCALPLVVVSDIAESIKPALDAKFRERLEAVFLASGDRQDAKKTHAEFDAKFRAALSSIFMFDNGLSSVTDDKLAEQLRGVLLRTLCTDLVNMAVSYQSNLDNMDAPLTPKVRDQSIAAMAVGIREPFEVWAKTLNKKESLADFFSAAESVCSHNVCSVQFKYPDKTARDELLKKHDAHLASQLVDSKDPAECLLLAVLLVYARLGYMVHATGKYVPQLVTECPADCESLPVLQECQKVVVKRLTSKQADSDLDTQVEEQLSLLKTHLGVGS